MAMMSEEGGGALRQHILAFSNEAKGETQDLADLVEVMYAVTGSRLSLEEAMRPLGGEGKEGECLLTQLRRSVLARLDERSGPGVVIRLFAVAARLSLYGGREQRNTPLPKDRAGRVKAGDHQVIPGVGEEARELGLAFTSLSAILCDSRPELTREDIAEALWSWATIGYQPGVESMESLTQSMVERMGAKELSLFVSYCAKTRYLPDEETIARVDAMALDSITDFTGQGISSYLWGWAKLGVRPEDEWMKEALKQAAFGVDWEYGNRPDNLSTILWSCARLGYLPPEDALLQMNELLEARAGKLDLQGLSNALWAYGRLHWRPPERTMALLCKALARNLRYANSQDISNCLWAWAKLEYDPAKYVWEQVHISLPRCARRMRSRELTMSLWALARLDYWPGPETMDALCSSVREQLRYYKIVDLCQTLGAVAALGHNPGYEWCEHVLGRLNAYEDASPIASRERGVHNVNASFEKMGFYELRYLP